MRLTCALPGRWSLTGNVAVTQNCRRRSNSGRFRRSKSERCVGSLTGLLVGGLTDAGQGVDAAVT